MIRPWFLRNTASDGALVESEPLRSRSGVPLAEASDIVLADKYLSNLRSDTKALPKERPVYSICSNTLSELVTASARVRADLRLCSAGTVWQLQGWLLHLRTTKLRN